MENLHDELMGGSHGSFHRSSRGGAFKCAYNMNAFSSFSRETSTKPIRHVGGLGGSSKCVYDRHAFSSPSRETSAKPIRHVGGCGGSAR